MKTILENSVDLGISLKNNLYIGDEGFTLETNDNMKDGYFTLVSHEDNDISNRQINIEMSKKDFYHFIDELCRFRDFCESKI
jgi:hypothetical protein